MIPKIIHYCWFGTKPLPNSVISNIASWKKYCPEYKIKIWNEKNFDIESHAFTKSAYALGLYAFVSDYVRLHAVYNEGGIYMDTDVEMLKPIDDLLDNSAFFGLEDIDAINTGLIFAADSKNKTVHDLLTIYDLKGNNVVDGIFNRETCVEITTKYFRNKGFKYRNRIQKVDECTIYPTEYFCPQMYGEKYPNITFKTYTFHKYDSTWIETDNLDDEYKFLLHARIARRIKGIVRPTIYNGIYNLYTRLKNT